jgi:hypothetical protein
MAAETSVPCCRVRKRDGTACAARPLPGKTCCFFHDPAGAAALAEARREGGRRRSFPKTVLPADLPDVTVQTVADVAPLLSATISQVRKGLLDPKIASTVGYLASVLIKAFEVGQIQERIARLEAATASTPVTSGAFHRTIAPPKELRHAREVAT